MSGYPSCRAATAASRARLRSARSRFARAVTAAGIDASARTAFLRRCSGMRRPLAAAAASRVSCPLRARCLPAALPSRIAGSNTSRAERAAARSLRVSAPSSGWPRSSPKASQ